MREQVSEEEEKETQVKDWRTEVRLGGIRRKKQKNV